MLSDDLNFEKTDARLWRLESDQLGATRWKYGQPGQQSFYVKHSLGSFNDVEKLKIRQSAEADLKGETSDAFNAAVKGARYVLQLQEESGILPMQYIGPMFMTIGYVVAHYVSATKIAEPVRIELVRYIVNSSDPVDGGWGLHNADKLTCFGTSINYVILRLLGVPADNVVCIKARQTLKRFGGAISAPHWGKAWLAVLNLYDWAGVNPAPPELWLTPYKGNFLHPARWWVHTRAVYQPLSYLSTIRYQCELDDLLVDIRSEIYNRPYLDIVFSDHRNNICSVDLYYPHTKVLDAMNWLVVQYDKVRPQWMLDKCLDRVYELIQMEMRNTGDLCIAPVSFSFNAVVVLDREGKDSELFKKMIDGFQEILFHGPKGMAVMGTNGGQVWDISFAVQYFFMAGLAEFSEFDEFILRGFNFLLRSQFTEDCVDRSFRDPRKGAFPYSTKTQGYTVSDCTAEAIKAILMVKNHPRFKQRVQGLVNEQLLFEGIDVLLSLQNTGKWHHGSFSTYEKIRSTPLLEKINPAEVFGNIMVEYPYVECTDSAVLGLTYFTQYYDYRKSDISTAIALAIDYIRLCQKLDGSWYGCWGVCFTYAGMFALEALSTVGRTCTNDDVVKKGCEFLVARQRPDGGWSEGMESCETHTYVETLESLVVQTSWALIGLILAKYPDEEKIKAGIEFLIGKQTEYGDWAYQSTEGVFNHSCAIEYPNYKFLFPIKALGLYSKTLAGTDTNYC